MNAPSDVSDLSTQIHNFGEMALRIKAQRDALAAALRDIVFGAEMIMNVAPDSGAFESYAKEVKRVASNALEDCQL
jgi:hypothetical protein